MSSRTIWQQAAGDTDRNYVDLCLRFGVILNGPGNLGPWPGCRFSLPDTGVSARKVTDLRRFAEEMREGDLVVLRVGTSKVFGVGEIVGLYMWSDEFGDVDGWDLQHVRRTRWLWDGRNMPQTFQTYALKQGDTTQKLGNGVVAEWIEKLPLMPIASEGSLPNLPMETGDITVEQISEFLFDRGVASSSITHLLEEIGELIRIAKWYQRSSMPSEHETVAYLAVPLLRALGWTPQRMAVEWNHVDIALFDKLPRADATLRVVVEAKKMDNSCLTAMSQAQSYAQARPTCHRLIVTDGLRYGVYIRTGVEPFQLYAYLNLTRLREAYPVYECRGAKEALLAMTPEWRE